MPTLTPTPLSPVSPRPTDSTFRPIIVSQDPGQSLDIELFSWDQRTNPDISVKTVQGPPVVMSATQGSPPWLQSNFTEYRESLYYLSICPSDVTQVNLRSDETGPAPLLGSMQIIKRETNPFGRVDANAIQVQSYLTNTQVQPNLALVPINWPIDELHFLEFQTQQNTSGSRVNFSMIFFWRKRVEPFRSL